MQRRGLWLVPMLAGVIALLALVGMRPRYFLRLARRLEGRHVQPLAPSPALDPPVAGSHDVRHAIAARSAAYLGALLAGDAAAYAASYHEDGLAMPGTGAIARGRDGIEAAMVQTFATMQFLEAEMATVDLELNGETAVETGHYRFLVGPLPDGAPRVTYGRYAIVWKRIADEWRIALDVAQPWAIES